MLADRILTLLTNPELAKKLGRSGKEYLNKKFSLERMVKEYFNLYQSLINK
jgi:glycosyltransferase involved in cell wall biosynthesis